MAAVALALADAIQAAGGPRLRRLPVKGTWPLRAHAAPPAHTCPQDAPMLLIASTRRRTAYRAALGDEQICAAAALVGWPSGPTAFFFESNDGLAAGDGDFTVDHSALGNGNAAGDDVGLNDCGRAYFQFLLDDELAGDTSGDDGGLCVDLAFPLRARGHAQCATDATIPAYRSADDQWATGFDVTGEVAPLGYEHR